MEHTMKRKIKDSVFTILFSEQDHIMDLYRTLHPEDNTITAEELTTVTLETALITSLYNDLGIQVRDTIIILMEAQSTFSWNLPFRLLLYLAETLDNYVSSHQMTRFARRPIRIPRPELYVVYTGHEDAPPVLRLSDLFADSQDNSETDGGNAERQRELREKYGGIELEVRVIRKTGNRSILDQYVRFCEITDEVRKEYGANTEEVIREVFRRSIAEGILVKFLESRKMEVQKSMRYMFDEEAALREHDEEMLAQGRAEEAEKGIRALIATVRKFSQSKDAAVQALMEQFSLLPQTAADKVALYWG